MSDILNEILEQCSDAQRVAHKQQEQIGDKGIRRKKKTIEQSNLDVLQMMPVDKKIYAICTNLVEDLEEKDGQTVKDVMEITLKVFTKISGVDLTVQYKLTTGQQDFFWKIMDTLDCEKPDDLIGRAMAIHFEQNGDFKNLRVDNEVTTEKLEQHLEKRKKKIAAKKAKRKAALAESTKKLLADD